MCSSYKLNHSWVVVLGVNEGCWTGWNSMGFIGEGLNGREMPVGSVGGSWPAKEGQSVHTRERGHLHKRSA